MEETEGITRGPVVVTGAAGYIGSWLVMRLLQRGYSVRATVRDPTNQEKVKPLLGLPRSKELLTIWRADLAEEGSFDEVVNGCTGVFHVATPINFESEDPENEVIKPTVDGVLSLMRSCKKAGTVKRVVFTSSAATVSLEEHAKPEYDESSWSDLDFIYLTKMTAWMYFAAKTLAEKAALDFAEENSLHLISIIPSLVVGPFISSSMPPSLITALALITGNEAFYAFISQMSFVHLDDLCNAHIFLFEHPDASGRFICSSHDSTILALAEMMNKRYPEYEVPTKFEGIDGSIRSVHFSSKKLQGLGFEYSYSVEEMFDEAIRCCREKKMLPLKKTEGRRDDAEEREAEKKLMDVGTEVETQATGKADQKEMKLSGKLST